MWAGRNSTIPTTLRRRTFGRAAAAEPPSCSARRPQPAASGRAPHRAAPGARQLPGRCGASSSSSSRARRDAASRRGCHRSTAASEQVSFNSFFNNRKQLLAFFLPIGNTFFVCLLLFRSHAWTMRLNAVLFLLEYLHLFPIEMRLVIGF